MDIQIVQTTYYEEGKRIEYYQIFKHSEILIPYQFSQDELIEVGKAIFGFLQHEIERIKHVS